MNNHFVTTIKDYLDKLAQNDEAYLAELKEIGKQVNEGAFFENLLAV